jgi:hypothetical protein
MSNRQTISRVTDDSINLTEENLQYLIQCIKAEINIPGVDVAYPIGYIYITSKSPNDGGNPNVLFPGTTWVQLPESYIYAAGNSDTVDGPAATPHGSNTRSASDLPNHQHSLRKSSIGTTNLGGSFSGNAKLLYSAYSGVTVTGSLFSVSASGGNWYGDNRSPKHTRWCKFSLTIPAHKHTIDINKNTNNSNMDIQPKHLYKYMWERTA